MFVPVGLPIYLDNNATTRLDPRVLEAMLPYLSDNYGNPSSSSHAFGWEAAAAVERARRDVAVLIGSTPEEVIFTSGATESDNLAIFGVSRGYRSVGNHIVTVATEHKAVLEPCEELARTGCSVTVLGVDSEGFVDIDELERSLRPETVLVSVMYGNNEIGTIQNIEAIGDICRSHRVAFHSDATQGVGQLPFNVEAMKVDLASFSAHKFHGPKGCGVLYLRRLHPGIRLARQQFGGGQEHGFRAGTLNVPGIVGLAAALRIAVEELSTSVVLKRTLRDQLLTGLRERLDGVTVNGPDPLLRPLDRLPGNLNVGFEGTDAGMLIAGCRDIAVSAGSACSSSAADASHVLRAIDPGGNRAGCSIRFGLGRFSTAEDVERATDLFAREVTSLRESLAYRRQPTA